MLLVELERNTTRTRTQGQAASPRLPTQYIRQKTNAGTKETINMHVTSYTTVLFQLGLSRSMSSGDKIHCLKNPM
jgi:hypothetical protein